MDGRLSDRLIIKLNLKAAVNNLCAASITKNIIKNN